MYAHPPGKEPMAKRDDPTVVKKDVSNPTTFGPPQVAPGVSDPRALGYAQRFAERHPPKYSTPVAGGPTPPIPRLDSDPVGPLTMSDQANQQRAPAIRQSGPFTGAGSLFSEMPAAAPTGAGAVPAFTRPPPGLLPNDLLPEAARKDPNFREGQGSMYAASQPALAYKYGVIRNKQHLLPQQLQGGPTAQGGLKPQTVEDLKRIAELQKNPSTTAADVDAKLAAEDRRMMDEAAASPAGMAGRLGNAPTSGPKPDTESAEERLKKLDDFDFNTLRDMMMKDIINNEDQRKIIEARCTPMTIDDILTKGYVTQRVPIIPNKFEPAFTSLTGEDDLALKRLVMKESQGIEVSERYLLDKFSLMTLAAGLFSVNSNPMPDFRDDKGHFNEDMFWEKFNRVIRFPFHMLASIGVNYFWFDIRVRKLFVAEQLGNG
jgi:hypothetical protein